MLRYIIFPLSNILKIIQINKERGSAHHRWITSSYICLNNANNANVNLWNNKLVHMFIVTLFNQNHSIYETVPHSAAVDLPQRYRTSVQLSPGRVATTVFACQHQAPNQLAVSNFNPQRQCQLVSLCGWLDRRESGATASSACLPTSIQQHNNATIQSDVPQCPSTQHPCTHGDGWAGLD